MKTNCKSCGVKLTGWSLKKSPNSRRKPLQDCKACKQKEEDAAFEAEYQRLLSAYALTKHVEQQVKVLKAKDVSRVNGNKRRAREKEADGSHSHEYIEYLLLKQKCKCIACLADISKNYHVDHIYPLSRGGSNGEDNIQLLCQPCNNKKHAIDPIEFLLKHKLRNYCEI